MVHKNNPLLFAAAAVTAFTLSGCGSEEASSSTSDSALSQSTTSENTCQGHDYEYPDADSNSCQKQLKLVDSVVAHGKIDEEGNVRTTELYCKPKAEEWLCGEIEDGALSEEAVRVVPKNPSSHPLKNVSNKSTS